MGDVINVHFKRKKHDDHKEVAEDKFGRKYDAFDLVERCTNLERLTRHIQGLLNEEIKENARLRA